MERKSGLGFGFFNKSKLKSGRKKGQQSERQLAEMYNKVAIRGSIKHVWGDEEAGGGGRPGAPLRAQTMPPLMPSDKEYAMLGVPLDTQLADSGHAQEADNPLEPRSVAGSGGTQNVMALGEELRSETVSPRTQGMDAVEVISRTSSPRMDVSPFMPRKLSADSGISHSVHKKFSFCPSTISLMSQRSPASAVVSPRSLSLTNNNNNNPYAQSHRSSVFSNSSPSLHRVTHDCARRHSDHISIADEEEEEGIHGAMQLSPSNSLCYSNSIISRISSSMDSPHPIKQEDRFLPGTIYADMLPDALRGLGSVNALPLQYDEEDESSSISGLSEVNADHSDSEFNSDSEAEETPAHADASMITTDIPDGLRRDSVKRVSYTRLENGEYLVAHKRRSRNSLDHAGVARSCSDASQWSIEREYVSGGI